MTAPIININMKFQANLIVLLLWSFEVWGHTRASSPHDHGACQWKKHIGYMTCLGKMDSAR